MFQRFLAILGLLWLPVVASANGLLIPEDKSLPPLAMVHHRVNVQLEDQVGMTEVEQSFRNHTDRQLEATYLFPVPKGASVTKFTMFVDGKEVAGELLEAGKAKQIYTDIVRRTQDPGLLEYLDHNVFRLRVFPILPKSDQRVKLRYSAVAQQDAGVVEYIYPMKTDGKATKTLEDLSINIAIKSQKPIQSIYSPTHAIDTKRNGDREATIRFERNQATLDKDFQLFYSVGNDPIGITTLLHRPISSEDGYFMVLLSPQVESSKKDLVPRDVVMVLDTSGSMDGVKMDQARKALKHCLSNLNPTDRFGVVSFATNVRNYREKLVDSTADHVTAAKKWVDDLRAGGGTAIQPALDAAMAMRPNEPGRTFTVIFFTDGQPTIGEIKPEKIVRTVENSKTSNTRIFTFGVGDDVNTAMLDQIADTTRAVSTYVRPAEDIEMKVSSLYAKISHPVMTNLKLTTAENVQLHEVYPPQLPDLFHGQQLVIFGRYSGQGSSAIKLNGTVGTDAREFAYDVTFSPKTDDRKEFVEPLWARRKVGYLLDQVRANGEKKELIDEIMVLAKKYGIATPYTSYLIVPDVPTPIVNPHVRVPALPAQPGARPLVLQSGRPAVGGGAAPPMKVEDFAKLNQAQPGQGANNRGRLADEVLEAEAKTAPVSPEGREYAEALRKARDAKSNFDRAQNYLRNNQMRELQTGRDGVDLAIASNQLRQQERLSPTVVKQANGRNCLDFGGVWIDEQFDATLKTVVVKAQGAAYFRILEKHPTMRDVYRLGNYIVWVTPSKTALIIDPNNGADQLEDAVLDALFVPVK